MQKILPITRVIMTRVYRILKIRRSRWRRKKKRKCLLRMAVKLKAPIESKKGHEIRRQSGNRKK